MITPVPAAVFCSGREYHLKAGSEIEIVKTCIEGLLQEHLLLGLLLTWVLCFALNCC